MAVRSPAWHWQCCGTGSTAAAEDRIECLARKRHGRGWLGRSVATASGGIGSVRIAAAESRYGSG